MRVSGTHFHNQRLTEGSPISTETRGSGYRLGYARVSTLEQDEAVQLDGLRSAGCDRLFVGKASGTLERRPAPDVMLEHIRPGDTIEVGRLALWGVLFCGVITRGVRTVTPRNNDQGNEA
jgi:hypothetical protein